VPVLSQWISVALLISMAATGIAIALRRYAGGSPDQSVKQV
jgi:hypothetical protein